MKYRVDVDIAFVNENDAKAFLNHIESIKTQVYAPTGEEAISLARKSEYGEEQYDYSELIITDSVNFDTPEQEH